MLDVTQVRIWVDFTNTAHVIVLRPLVERLEAAGHEVALTARPLSHTVELLEDWGHPHLVVGRYGGMRRRDKALAAADRVRRLLRWARAQRFDRALAHGSTDVPVVSRLLRIPNTTMFDYEWAATQHHVNCRLADRVLVPEAIPPERLARYGARGKKLIRYPGLKEEYYLSDFEPDRGVLADLGVEGAEVLCVVRTAPSYALYLGGSETPLLAQVLWRASADPRVHTVVLARTDEQRADVRALGLERVVVPDRTVDGRSLVALADVLVSAGGTMNREAAVLGTPVWSMFEGPLGGVDEQLVREGRLKLLQDAAAIAFEPKPAGALAERVRRDPADLLELALPGLLMARR
jgi:predicted glycosyltransferase